MQRTLSFALILGAFALSYATGDLNKLDQELKTQASSIKSIVQTIINIILGIFGAVSLVKLIQIFISQGSGEEKINKAGTWIFLLIFVAAGYFLVKAIFGT